MTSKNTHQSAPIMLIELFIVFLALIGDGVIFLSRSILFLFKKSFSILKNNLSWLAAKKYHRLLLKLITTILTRILSNLLLQSRYYLATPKFSKNFIIPKRRKVSGRQKSTPTSLSPTATAQIYKHLIRLLDGAKSGFVTTPLPALISLNRQAALLLSRIWHRLFILTRVGFTRLTIWLGRFLSQVKQRGMSLIFFVFSLPKTTVRLIFTIITLPFRLLPKPPAIVTGFIIGSLTIFLLVFIPFYIYLFLKLLPHPKLLSNRVIPVTTQVFDRHGELLYEFHGPQDRKPMPLDNIPSVLVEATIAIEDKDFYLHPGFSIPAIARAAHETLINHNLQGGSTLTQQLIKNALLTNEVSYSRKLQEIVLAYWAERFYTKRQILEMYLNQVPYGGTAWGIQAAAITYFGKNVEDLTLAEAAYLAGLPAAPTSYSPFTHPDRAKNRQEQVLARMYEEGFITQAEKNAALTQPITIKPPTTPIKAPHFVMFVRDVVSRELSPRLVDQGGLKIYTTLDLNLQEQVQQLVTDTLGELTPLNVTNGAAVVTDPQTGEILAMVGSTDYFNEARDGNVNVTLSHRQPGSSIKVVTYTAALENGFTAASIIRDTPVAFPVPGQPEYKPVNYDGRFHGPVTLRAALANSYNVPAVQVLNKIGLDAMLDMGKRLGITTWNNTSRFGLALTLGGGEVTLYDMAQVYGVFANQGRRFNLDPITKITDYKGQTYYERKDTGTQVISPEIAFIISDVLADNRARIPAFGPNSALVIPDKTVSVKTGTTNDFRDNWTIGYTKDYVVGVWVGNNDNSPMNSRLVSGVTGAAPLWNKIMTWLIKDRSDHKLTPPPNIIAVPCYGRREYFVLGTQPKTGCPRLSTPQPSAADEQ